MKEEKVSKLGKLDKIKFECLVCGTSISWRPMIVLYEVSSFECPNTKCGQHYRVDKVNFETNEMNVVLVDRQEAVNAMKEEGLT